MEDAGQAAPLGAHRDSSIRFLGATLLVSLAAHGLLLSYLEARKLDPVVAKKPVELVMFEAPPPPKVEPPPPEEPKPEPVKVKVKAKPPPVLTAETKPPPPVPDDAPPPPNDAPPPDPAAKPPPLVVGISMSSTTTAGTFSAPVGNTAYGKTANKAVNPSDVKGYSAPRYVAPSQVDSDPSVLFRYDIPPRDYPPDAKKNGIEGEVLLKLTIDFEGKLTDVKVLRGPGYGLEEAAREAIRKFKFRPAVKGGQPVTTDLQYLFRFVLD